MSFSFFSSSFFFLFPLFSFCLSFVLLFPSSLSLFSFLFSLLSYPLSSFPVLLFFFPLPLLSFVSLKLTHSSQDVLGKQLLDNVAEDATIEDMIYYLDRALLKAVIDVDQYLKEIRRLSREQFYCRATIKKIHLVQQSQRR